MPTRTCLHLTFPGFLEISSPINKITKTPDADTNRILWSLVSMIRKIIMHMKTASPKIIGVILKYEYEHKLFIYKS